jgi:hypothetical protein
MVMKMKFGSTTPVDPPKPAIYTSREVLTPVTKYSRHARPVATHSAEYQCG